MKNPHWSATDIKARQATLVEHQQALRDCTKCEDMIRPVITGAGVLSPIMSVGQAPGIREGELQRPFAWTAGKTLFKWFESIGVDEMSYREQVYMAAVCRCFPGKNPKGGGDRVPNKQEIAHCKTWIDQEYQILQPDLIIPIGRLAIEQYLDFKTLAQVVGQQHIIDLQGKAVDIIPLPHPSGLSTWFRTEPGKTLLQDALLLLAEHPVWIEVFKLDNR